MVIEGWLWVVIDSHSDLMNFTLVYCDANNLNGDWMMIID